MIFSIRKRLSLVALIAGATLAGSLKRIRKEADFVAQVVRWSEFPAT